LWDTQTGEALLILKGHNDRVNAVALGQAAGLVVVATGSGDSTARLWDAHTGAGLLVLAGHTREVRSVALGEVMGRSVVATASEDGTARLWDARTGQQLALFDGPLYGVALSGDLIALRGSSSVLVIERRGVSAFLRPTP
jgi:WD40 repeat protein